MAADKSKIRMNMAAIKKVDPYAKDIVDSSSHVAFYTFNSNVNEWEKTDVEGAFFIYSRNAQPFYSIFINNRLNTNSFVEPVTAQLELQSQPPFLLYRNERSRIRGFWFYNSQECDRIGNLVITLVKKQTISATKFTTESFIEKTPAAYSKHCTTGNTVGGNVNIFKMLSKAQQEYNNMQTAISSQQNVLNFFASAKPTTAEVPFFQRVLPNTLSVEQLEQRHRLKSPLEDGAAATTLLYEHAELQRHNSSMPSPNTSSEAFINFPSLYSNLKPSTIESAIAGSKSSAFGTTRSVNKSPIAEKEKCLRQILIELPSSLPHSIHLINNELTSSATSKPALMPPTMFDKPNDTSPITDNVLPCTRATRPDPLSATQLVEAFTYLMQNDEDFVQKLHATYLKILAKTVAGTYQ